MPSGDLSAVRLARLSADPIGVDEILEAVRDPSCGGIALFVGTVRDADPDTRPGRVTALDYTAHPSAQAELARVAQEVATRHAVSQVAVAHRIGKLVCGDIAVVVGCAAVHRGPALEACRDLIDTLKQQVPIWKEQTWTGGDVTWSGI